MAEYLPTCLENKHPKCTGRTHHQSGVCRFCRSKICTKCKTEFYPNSANSNSLCSKCWQVRKRNPEFRFSERV